MNGLHEMRPMKSILSLEWTPLLAYSVLNSLFWTCTFGGTLFLLFLNKLGLSPSQIGLVLSLFPFCGLLALGFAPLANRWGRKRVFLVCDGVRKLIAAGLLLLPWLLIHTGQPTVMFFLFTFIWAFAILRALTETAYYPWSQEFVLNQRRGQFIAATNVAATVASCLGALVVGYILDQSQEFDGFLLLIASGCALGLFATGPMFCVPGGAPIPATARSKSHLGKMKRALHDQNFIYYLGGLGWVTVGSSLLLCFLPLHLKEHLGISDGTLLWLDAVMLIGGMVATLLCGWLADRVGSRPVLMPALALGVFTAVAWLLFPRMSSNATVWCTALYLLQGMAINGIGIGTGRLLLNRVVPPENNTAYLAIYYAWMGVAGGVAPLLAGCLLSACDAQGGCNGALSGNGQALLFLLSAVLLALGWEQYGRVKPDGAYTTRTAIRCALNSSYECLCGLADVFSRLCKRNC